MHDMSEIIRIESPEFESYYALTTWLDMLEASPALHPKFDLYTINEVLQVFATHRQEEDVYSATLFVLASPDDEDNQRTEKQPALHSSRTDRPIGAGHV